MLFNSYIFVFLFFPLVVFGYYAFHHWKKPKMALGWLLLMSMLFYGYNSIEYLFILITSVILNFGVVELMSRAKRTALRRLLLAAGLGVNLGILFYYKYYDFFIENINAWFQTDYTFLRLMLPLGISFYTFQQLSYVIDSYRGECEKYGFLEYASYVTFFPQLIAGPIVVYSDIADALKKRSVSIQNIDSGLKTFIVGLGYKVIIANRIGTLWNEVCTIGFESISTPLAWLGAVAYSMQLYFDFWGYSVMAIGLGEMLGFKMPENFRYPYTARSVTEFWRRWHITLGTWFREYVYIPLGGNRKGTLRTVFHLFVVWLLVGFWHGAAWNFVLWGLLIFALLVIEKTFLLRFLNGRNFFSYLLSHLYILIYIPVSWVIFAITDFSELRVYFMRLFPFIGGAQTAPIDDFWRLVSVYAPLLIASVIFSSGYPQRLFEKIRDNVFGILIALAVFWYSVYLLSIGINNPFLYFRF